MSGKDFVKKLQADGWALDRVKGSHHILFKGVRSVSVPIHANDDLPPGTLHSLMKKAGYK
jgi:predicted RNA binding protein YcfA (HicA-like mRNA interferase family)